MQSPLWANEELTVFEGEKRTRRKGRDAWLVELHTSDELEASLRHGTVIGDLNKGETCDVILSDCILWRSTPAREARPRVFRSHLWFQRSVQASASPPRVWYNRRPRPTELVDPAILLKRVTKTFGSTTAVRDLDLIVPRGGLYGFIGPNGAGKTTSIRMIMSILFPDSGELSVLGRSSAREAKDRIGYLPEERGVYRKMRVGAFLTYMARLKGLRDTDLSGRVKRSLERVGLEDTERKRCDELSKGMQQKIQFLAAIVHEPDLLILDEPFSGLDPVSARQLRDLVLAEHRRGATGPVFDARDAPGGRDLPARRDDPPGT